MTDLGNDPDGDLDGYDGYVGPPIPAGQSGPGPRLPRFGVWCEHCRDHFSDSHYTADDISHAVGDEYGPYGRLLARERGLAAVRELLAWARKVSPVRPVVEAAWVQEALDTGRMPDLGEHRKAIV
jgi:hypothetical protein